jgi:hypothetical protein
MLLSRDKSQLLIVDVQDKLLDAISGKDRVVERCVRLVRTARMLHVPITLSEQYPQGLGPTTPELLPLLKRVFDKTAFSCGACADLCDALRSLGPHKWLVCGIETHVCVQQSVLDLLAEGICIYVAADAYQLPFRAGGLRHQRGDVVAHGTSRGQTVPCPSSRSWKGRNVRSVGGTHAGIRESGRTVRCWNSDGSNGWKSPLAQ